MGRFLTPDEAAQTLKVQVTTVRRWLRDGTLRGSKLGRVWRIPETEIRRIEEGASPAVPGALKSP